MSSILASFSTRKNSLAGDVSASASTGDVLDFSDFLVSGSVANSASSSVYVPITTTAAALDAAQTSGADIDLANGNVLLIDAAPVDANGSALGSAATDADYVAALIVDLANDEAWDAINVAGGAHAVIIDNLGHVFSIDNDSNPVVSTGEVTLVGTLTDVDIAAFMAGNFSF